LHRTTGLAVGLLVVVMLIVASSAEMMSVVNISSYGVIKQSLDWLRVEGQWIVDESGNKIQLRGVGMTYNGYDWMDRAKGYIDTMAGRGLNVARLAFCHPDFPEGSLPVYDPIQMDEILDYLEAKGMYAILDNHQYWATAWQPDATPEDWISMWVEIATRYANRSSVLGYEINNEPYGTMFGSYSFPDLAVQCLQAIRQVDQKHIVFLAEYYGLWHYWMEGDIWTGRRFWKPAGRQGEGTVVPSDPNIVFHMHHWPGAFTGGATLDTPTAYCEASEYVYFLRFLRDTLQRPVWAGEFGAYDITPGSGEMWHCRNIFDQCNEAGIMWTMWMMEHNYDWNWLIPTPYTTSVIPSDVPRPFNPLPFNMLQYTTDYSRREIGYNRWGSGFYQLPSGDWVSFKGPCQVKIVKWASYADFINQEPLSEEIVNIPESGGTITNTGSEFMRIFPYMSM
jgi:hypothetical protein